MNHHPLQLAILYGGKNTEHEISILSALNIVKLLDPNEWQTHLIAIHPEGQWYWQDTAAITTTLPTVYTPERLIQITMDMSAQPFSTAIGRLPAIDVVFPILHGLNGEDGTIQGLLKCLNLPFIGCDVLASSICMDKIAMKQCLQSAGIPTAPWRAFQTATIQDMDLQGLITALGLPVFVKAANAGSSVGVIKVKYSSELEAAIQEVSQFDHKFLVEAMITGREIELSVLGNLYPEISQAGEIKVQPQYDFYSYEAKYLDHQGAILSYPADLIPEQIQKLQTTALAAFKALHCEGMARVDCFLTAAGTVYINELNTIPGFTSISMYPKLWEISGKDQKTLIKALIQLAQERFERQKLLRFRKYS